MNKAKDHSISMKLSMLAKSKGLTQKYLAEKCGLSRITIHRFFNGHTELKCNDFAKLLNQLGINIDKLIDETLESSMTGQLSEPEPLYTDVAVVLKNLNPETRKTLLQQISWCGKSSAAPALITANKRIIEYIEGIMS